MNYINVSKGLLKSLIYLKDVEYSIRKFYNFQETKTNNYLIDLEKFQIDFFENIAKRLPNLNQETLSNNNQKQAYLNAIKNNSARKRALLLFLGSLCSKKIAYKKALIYCGTSIELIHKMSLILDDYFDGDLLRRGKPVFYIEYNEKIMLEIPKLLLKISNSIFTEGIKFIPTEYRNEFINLYKEIIINMGTGFIEDLDRKERKIDIEDAFRINDLQSTIILKNSLLIGYSLSQGKVEKNDIYLYLEKIGLYLGKIFQGFNDIEDFSPQKSKANNKAPYSDLIANRKNIILGQVPKELFYSPFSNEDIIIYIEENNLISDTTAKLSLDILELENTIQKLTDSIGKDTLQFLANKVLRKIKQ